MESAVHRCGERSGKQPQAVARGDGTTGHHARDMTDPSVVFSFETSISTLVTSDSQGQQRLKG
ncbi:hypothetical protein GCM10022403_085330 [Streptomyces coacervatus]|uniref:Uncharacterized protein n=1 Tax=Streptomyces coacervatus TaxID=647381 RepID=A0ABP7JBE9_9ACTN